VRKETSKEATLRRANPKIWVNRIEPSPAWWVKKILDWNG